MEAPAAGPPHATASARAVLLLALAGLALVWAAIFRPDAAWAMPAVYLLLVPLAGLVVFAVRWWLQGEPRGRDPGLAWAGLALIVGGPVLDIGATLWHTPDLAEEANPIARLLLDRGTPLGVVHAYAGLAQALFVSFQVALWLGWWRHRDALLETAWQQGNASFLHYLKAATGAGHLGWRAWLLPLELEELPWAHHVLAVVTPPVVLSEGGHRLWLGLQWFGLVPWVPEQALVAVLTLAAFVLMALWLFLRYRVQKRAAAGQG